jgi:hypothetical protein
MATVRGRGRVRVRVRVRVRPMFDEKWERCDLIPSNAQHVSSISTNKTISLEGTYAAAAARRA